jgi:hypothetical protein
VLGAYFIKYPEAPQHGEELRGFADLPAQLVRSREGVFYLWGCIAPGGYQRSAQGDLQRELLPDMLRGIR